MAFYEKTLLYLYPDFKRLTEAIDKKFTKYIAGARVDTSPAIEQCQKLIALTTAKKAIIEVGGILKETIEKFSPTDKNYLQYKYFGKKDLLDETVFKSKSYFRRQKVLADKIRHALSRAGFSETRFIKELLPITFVKEIHRRVELKEHAEKEI